MNLTAPTPVTNAELSRALGHALGTARRATGSEHGDQAALWRDGRDQPSTGQRAIPARLGELGDQFRHPAIEPALKDVLSA